MLHDKDADTRNKAWQSYLNQAREHLRRQQGKDAVACYFKAACEMARSGDLSLAAATYKLILKEEPDNPLALTLLSSLYHNQGLAAEVSRLQAGAPDQDPALKSVLLRILRQVYQVSEETELPWLPRLTDIFQLSLFRPGEVLIREGARNRTVYLVIAGRLTVSYRPPDGNKDTVITELGPGAIFGEFSMLTGEKAAATVR
ncbi:MAG: cyclic nucleotide-binding domain-containing protein, partial [Deltaproteobacteria bacterium]|nr:cyclic nucleotide-binding domain-containing protein [Deltaproteobacteria bacterium]